MRCVIDTNILLVAVGSDTSFSPVFDAITLGRIELLVSTAILLEYTEVMEAHLGEAFARRVLLALDSSGSLVEVDPHYQWRLITADPDDDKFVDCAVAGNAESFFYLKVRALQTFNSATIRSILSVPSRSHGVHICHM